MAYKFNPCAQCPCGAPGCTPVCAYVAWHGTLHPTMQLLHLKAFIPTFGPTVPDDWKTFINSMGTTPPTQDTNGVLVFSTDGLVFVRPLKPDGFNVLIELFDAPIFAPNPAIPHNYWKRIKRFTISKGAESVAYQYDAISDRLLRDDAGTTLEICANFTFATLYTARLFTKTQLYSPWSVRWGATFAGFGPAPNCTVMNGVKILNASNPGHFAFPSIPTFRYIDGWIVNLTGVEISVFVGTEPTFFKTYIQVSYTTAFVAGTCTRTDPTNHPFDLTTATPSLFSVFIRLVAPGIGFGPNRAWFSLFHDKPRAITTTMTHTDFYYDPVRTGIPQACAAPGMMTDFTETLL